MSGGEGRDGLPEDRSRPFLRKAENTGADRRHRDPLVSLLPRGLQDVSDRLRQQVIFPLGPACPYRPDRVQDHAGFQASGARDRYPTHRDRPMATHPLIALRLDLRTAFSHQRAGDAAPML